MTTQHNDGASVGCCPCVKQPQEEVAGKTRQLRALYSQYKERRAEAADLQAAFQAEREDLLADYRALTQQIKLKHLAIAAFIPPPYQDLILARCRWSEYDERWVVDGIEAAGVHVCCVVFWTGLSSAAW